jgi:hypothetical protein
MATSVVPSNKVTEHATELALRPLFGNQFNTAVNSISIGASDIGLSHVREIPFPSHRSNQALTSQPQRDSVGEARVGRDYEGIQGAACL